MTAGPFTGYHQREVPPDDAELTRVGPGTPCGEYMRRFWQPVAFLRDLGDVALRVRMLGEDLVVFRDRRGQVGLLHLHCALEHLASTDRGVIMLRRIVSDGIRAVGRGEDPFGVARVDGAPVRTLAQDSVLEIPALADPAADRRLLRKTGRRVVAGA